MLNICCRIQAYLAVLFINDLLQKLPYHIALLVGSEILLIEAVNVNIK